MAFTCQSRCVESGKILREQLQDKVDTKRGGMSTSLTICPCRKEKWDRKLQQMSSRDMAGQRPANPVSQVSSAHPSVLSLTLCNLSFGAKDPPWKCTPCRRQTSKRGRASQNNLRPHKDGFQHGRKCLQTVSKCVCSENGEDRPTLCQV